MSLRVRILLGSSLLIILPLLGVWQIVRTGVSDRFTAQDTQRVEDQMRVAREDLDRQSARLAGLLDALADGLRADNRFRLAAVAGREDLRPYLVDYAPRHMSLMDLDLLLIQDDDGRVVSSGHFRNAFGELDPDLPRLLGHVTGGQALITARSPEGPFLALARTRIVTLGDSTFHLTGGLKLAPADLRNLGHDADLVVLIIWPDGMLTTRASIADRFSADALPEEVEYLLRRQGLIVRGVELPLIDDADHGSAYLLVAHDQAALRQTLTDMNLRMAAVFAAALLVALGLAVWLAARLSRPLRDLSARTEDLDLDRLDVEFPTDGSGEVGRLSRLLGDMTGRLRDGVHRLRAAENRATMGEMARQVNHDIRNGLTPLRNVLRHLTEVAENEPDKLPEIYRERRETLEGGMAYLEDLATHYARLSPGRVPEACKLDRVIAQALADPAADPGVTLVNRLPANLPPVEADPVSLRRIFDNLLRNAVESLPEGRGTVEVNGCLEEDPNFEELRIMVEVSDTGVGIPTENLDLIFNDFFTTRPQGTGLGLSNVRRLLADCGATVRVASATGQGTTFTLSFPVRQPGNG